MLHKFKMTSTDAFFVFSKFWFSGLLGWREGGKRVQKLSKMTKQICLTLYLRNCTSYDCGFWHTCVKCWYLQHFFFFFFPFFIILIFLVFQSLSIKAKRKLWGLPHLLHICVASFCIFIQPFQKCHMQYYVPCQLVRLLDSHLPNLIADVLFSYS